MKKIIIVLSCLISVSAFAVCTSPISRNNENLGPKSASHNTDMNSLYAHLNELPGDCIVDGTILTRQLPDGSISTAKVADGSVTDSKIASGVIPAMGRLLRVRSFSSPGAPTWIKQTDVGFVQVHVIGGGGGITTAGGTSSFGSHCVAGGGANSSSGAGGSASNGSINLPGGNGEKQTFNSSVACFVSFPIVEYCPFRGAGGRSYFGTFGQGGSTFVPPNSGSTRIAPGSGAYCSKIIPKELLGDSEAIKVGAGGTGPANSNPGRNGLVIVFEYSK